MSNGADVGGAPAPATVISVGAALLQQGKVLPSFAQFAVTGEDNLQVTVVGSVPGLQLNIQGRFLDVHQSQVIPFDYAVAVPSNRTVTTALFSLGTGYLLNLTAFTSGSPAPIQGQVYVLVQMVRGLTGATFLLGTLVGGYVTNIQPLGWPGSPIVTSLEGPGAIRSITGTTPAPGAAITETVPTGARWELIAVHHFFTTSVAAPSRVVFMQLDDGVRVHTRSELGTSIAASKTFEFSWAQNFPQVYDGNSFFAQAPIPNRYVMRAGDRMIITALNLDPADAFTVLTYEVTEWLEP